MNQQDNRTAAKTVNTKSGYQLLYFGYYIVYDYMTNYAENLAA